MPKKPDKIKGSKIRSVHEVDSTKEVGKVSEVDRVKGARGVSKRKSTREMSWQEREKLFGMVKEEAQKLFGKSNISSEQREVIERAVKIAIDASIPEEENQGESKQAKRKEDS